MASNRPPRMPVRLNNRRTLHLAEKTPQHLNIFPTKRNILGQCSTNSPHCPVRAPPQHKIPVPIKMALPINNARTGPFVGANPNRTLNSAPDVRGWPTQSPLVPLEEYEKHHEGPANVGIFKDFEQFRALPASRIPQFACSQSSKQQQGKSKRNTTFVNGGSFKKNVGKALIPIPRSPNLLFGVRKVPSNVCTGVLSAKKDNDLSSKSVILGNSSLGKTYASDMYSVRQVPLNLPTVTEKNTFTDVPSAKKDNDLAYKSAIVGNPSTGKTYPSNVYSVRQAPLDVPTVTDVPSAKKDMDLAYKSCILDNLSIGKTYANNLKLARQSCKALLQEQYDLQNQQIEIQKQQASLHKDLIDIQQKQSNCLEKLINLQEKHLMYLQDQNISKTQFKSNIDESLLASTLPEIRIESASPAPKKRRSARLEMLSNCAQRETQLIATTSDVSNIHTQSSTTKDNDSSMNALPGSIKTSTRKRASRRKSVVDYYGGLRSSFKDLLQTPKETPCPGSSKSVKKVQFTVQDTPARLTSTVMKQLNSLYDS